MPQRALTMRQIREILRLKYEAGLSYEKIARALSLSKGVIAKYVERLERTGQSPEQLLGLTDTQLLEHVRPRPHARALQRVLPDYGHVHAELFATSCATIHPPQLSARKTAAGQGRSLEVLPRAVAATAIYARHIVDGDAVDPLANKPRILGDEVWSADSSLRRSDPG